MGTWWDMEREGNWKGKVWALGREWEGDEKLMYEEVKKVINEVSGLFLRLVFETFALCIIIINNFCNRVLLYFRQNK